MFSLLLSVFITAIIYLLFPMLILFFYKKVISKKVIIIIVVTNSILVFTLFSIFLYIKNGSGIANSSATFIWSVINYYIIKKVSDIRSKNTNIVFPNNNIFFKPKIIKHLPNIRQTAFFIWASIVTISLIILFIRENIGYEDAAPVSAVSHDKTNINIEGIWEINTANGLQSCWHFDPNGKYVFVNFSGEISTKGQYDFIGDSNKIILTDDYSGEQEVVSIDYFDDILQVHGYSLLNNLISYYKRNTSNHIHPEDLDNYDQVNHPNTHSGPITAEDIERIRKNKNKDFE